MEIFPILLYIIIFPTSVRSAPHTYSDIAVVMQCVGSNSAHPLFQLNVALAIGFVVMYTIGYSAGLK